MEQLSIILLAIAISLDGFNVGMTYGLQGIIMNYTSILIISITSMIAIFLTGNLGVLISNYIDLHTAEIIGSLILMIMGSWLIYVSYRNKRASPTKEKGLNINLKIKSIKIVIKILKEPKKADIDKSGSICKKEAMFLGVALALDAMGAGLGAALNGFAIKWLVFYIGIISYSFINGGYILGGKLEHKLPAYFNYLPGTIMIILAIVKLTF